MPTELQTQSQSSQSLDILLALTNPTGIPLPCPFSRSQSSCSSVSPAVCAYDQLKQGCEVSVLKPWELLTPNSTELTASCKFHLTALSEASPTFLSTPNVFNCWPAYEREIQPQTAKTSQHSWQSLVYHLRSPPALTDLASATDHSSRLATCGVSKSCNIPTQATLEKHFSLFLL